MAYLMIAWFVAASTLVGLVALLWAARKTRVDRRVIEVSGVGAANSPGDYSSLALHGPSSTTDNRINRWTKRRLHREDKKSSLKQKMTEAGFYQPRTVRIFFVLKMFLMGVPAAIGLIAANRGYIPVAHGLIFGCLAGLVGTLTPGLWLNHVKRCRQTQLRCALPDALDVMVICLEGGLSLAGSFSRVAKELATAHPMLAVEFSIIERQIQMGRTTGEAVRGLADRFDLEELRSMSSVIVQAERVGASVATALRVFADTLRQKRHQRAEELAHKASVKLLFPTIFFIFPGIFVVVLGPAAIRIYNDLINGALRQ